MRLFRRRSGSKRTESLRWVPNLEALEDRTLPSANALFGSFDSAKGLLALHGDGSNVAVYTSQTPAGFVEVTVGKQQVSSDPNSASYDSALAGASVKTLNAIQLDGKASSDRLVLGNFNVTGGLSVASDGALEVDGQVNAAGAVQLNGQVVELSGNVRAEGPSGGSITVTAGNVLQSGALEADGGGSIRVDFTGSYVATVSAVTSASTTGTGNGGVIVIDGHDSGTFFTSGSYQANAAIGGNGGEIDLFAHTVALVGAHVDASGTTRGGWVRVGGDSPVDIAAHGGSANGVTYADSATVDANTFISTNALSNGDGGQIVVWSEVTTNFGGTLQADGAGKGRGGLLEVSSDGVLNYGGKADATAPSGLQGRLLLDPKNININAGAGLPQISLVNPSPSVFDTFGASIVKLSNGNVVVTDPTSSIAANFGGAVYLYDGLTGALLGTLTGSSDFDGVGEGGVTALGNGDFVVGSPSWHDGSNSVGAATWVSGTGGSVTTVTNANSLVGSNDGDQVGYKVTALTNNNYVVASPFWQDGGNIVGAVTWSAGDGSTVGAVSDTNSLVGSTNFDEVGSDGVTALTNGNYVVSSSFWQNPNGTGGAVTWGDGLGGTVGAVAATNSLTADVGGGSVGPNVTALSNGNYVVASPFWQDGGLTVGAATWADGSAGLVDVVTDTNSLVGSNDFDTVGIGGVTALSDGSYVVNSRGWHNGTDVVGAVTWAASDGSTVGAVTDTNSLVGSTDQDQVGSGGVTALANGNFVVSSPNWQEGGFVGAVTWGHSGGTTVGAVTDTNSLVGSTDGDQVGSGGVTVLTSGNYVVISPNWAGVGAVTLAQSDGSTVGAVSDTNSLVGSTLGDQVGFAGVTALSNGNFTVASPFWRHNGAQVGAVTLAQADGSTVGAVSTGNSLIGATDGDQVGSGGVVALSNGNYVISSPDWHQAGHELGAVTWSNGNTGATLDGLGAIDSFNSLIGPGSAILSQILSVSGDATIVASFNGNGGSVILGQVAASTEAFALAAGQTLNLSPEFITATLDSGTDVTLQASNDIMVNAPIVVNNPIGNGGHLTLMAGRQILLFASITTDNGDLTLISNATAADGVVSAQRDGLVADISMFAGVSIDAGSGNVTISLGSGAGNTNFASDDVTLGDITAHDITLTNAGPGDQSIGGFITGGGVDLASITASGNLTILSSLDISQDGTLSESDPGILNVTGTTTLTVPGIIEFQNPANQFGGLLTYNSMGHDVILAATGNLTLASAGVASELTVSIGGTLTQSGPLSATGASSFTAGTITLTDAGNDFTGTVSLTTTGSSASAFTNSTDLLLGDVTLAGDLTLSALSITFTGSLSIGSHTLTLTTSAVADLDGATTVAGGTIAASSGLVLNNGASLSGTGTVQVGAGAAGVSVLQGATLSPGQSPTGLTIDGDLTLALGSTLSEDIQNLTHFSQLSVNGDIDLGNATLQVSLESPYVPAAFDIFQIITNLLGDVVAGTFAQGSSITAGSTPLAIFYNDGASKNTVLFTKGTPTFSSLSSPTVLFGTASTIVSGHLDANAGLHLVPAAEVVHVTLDGVTQDATLDVNNDFSTTFATDSLDLAHSPYTISFAYDGDTDFTAASDTSTLTVTRAPQTISFTASSPETFGHSVTLSATGGGSGNAVTFSVISGPGAINGTTLTFTGIGTVVVQADQTGNAFYLPATAVQQTIVVNSTFPVAPAPSEIENGTPTKVTVASLLTGHYTDLDGTTTPKPGIAVFQVGGAGTWQYSANGSTWTNVGTVTVTQALLLPNTYSVRFVPTANTSGSATLHFVGWDASQGKAATKVDASSGGTTNAFSVSAGTLDVAVIPTPIWVGTGAILAPLAPGSYLTSNAVTPAGGTITTIFGGFFHDDNHTATVGVAVTGVTGTGTGTWQFSIDGGTTWANFPTVSASSSLLLSASDLVRYVPRTTAASVASLTALGWDGSVGVHNTRVNPSTLSHTAFSPTTLTALTAANHAPTLTAGALSTAAVASNATGAAITVSSLLTQAGYADVDGASLAKGIAVTGTSSTVGAAQYLLPGGTWQAIPSVSINAALLLPSNASIRFVANSLIGTATLTFAGWDETQGASGKQFNIANRGGATAFSATSTVLSTLVRQAPTWSATAGAGLTPMLPGTYLTSNANTPAGDTVTSIFGSFFQDADNTVHVGVAVSAVAGKGTWQFSTDGGTSWTTFTTPSASAATLLSANDKIRFVPSTAAAGTATLTAYAWDGSIGTHGTTVNVGTLGTGAAHAFSATKLVAVAAANNAPTLTAGALNATPVATNATSSPTTISTLLTQAGYADIDGASLAKGIAVTGTASTVGAAQYMIPGGTWHAIPSVSIHSALLLPSNASIKFVANNQLGTATLTFVGWDQTQGASGQLFDITSQGSPTAFSAASTVLSTVVGQAPSWSATAGAGLTPILPGAYLTSNTHTPAGDTVGSVFGGYFQDADNTVHTGIAVSAVTGNGAWQYSLNSGTSWVTFTTPSASSATLLSENDLIRFVPATTAASTPTLTAYAWDGSVGTHGTTVNVGTLGTGGAHAFSATKLVATAPVNRAPTVATTSYSLSAQNENVSTPTITASSLLTRSGYADPDGASLPSGIAISGDTGAGTWQWMNGATWTALPSVSAASVFVLPSTAQLRFVPSNNLPLNTSGSATLTYRGWDKTAGVASTLFPLATEGGATAFSMASATATLPINFVHQAPTWRTGASANFTPVLGLSTSNLTPNPAGDLVSAVFGGAVQGLSFGGIAITAVTGTAFGTWQYSTNNGTTWTAFPTVSTSAALLLSTTAKVRFLPSRAYSGSVSLTAVAWDGTGGFGNTVNLNTAGRGTTKPFSATNLIASALINTAPTLA